MSAAVRGARAVRSEDVRRGNLSTLLGHLHVHGATSRSALTQLLTVNRSTIGDLTADLAAAGLVREEVGPRPARSAGGRPSFVVVPEAERVQVLAVDIGVTHLTVARVGLGGQVLARRDLPRRRGPRGVAPLVRSIGEVCHELVAELPEGVALVGAGAAVPGMVRVPDGMVRQVPNLRWKDVPLGRELARELALPVVVGNDADLGALAEHVRGVAVGCDDVVYIVGHSGIGAGVFTSGRPLVGAHGYAGEVGHLAVNPDGRDCLCGRRGCWETEAGEERLLALAGRKAGGGHDAVREVVAAAAAGEPAASAALEHVARWLGIGAACVINVFNPEIVVLGGALAEVFRASPDTVHAAVRESSLGPHLETVRLVEPQFGDDSALLGAAELAFAPLLADPLTEMSRLRAS
ncbi:MAG TPA: ROK family protein [Nocardioidaceae bacterium]|nr:ROK family protein [Nocardioidaceae bacterium]